ncbi:Histone lysine acetyltransferase crebbp [Clonorchis sinensis]|uniref:histone acetyltransferase n=1 Tax=Clonorchis sinensis TaxID=79923 RepID=A0A8T1MMY9_CLOSI|nr:Histone lysine acetyltransferase crebbp [Clonorchis sinensis]
MQCSAVEVKVTPTMEKFQNDSTSMNCVLMQRQLALLLHAERCRRLENDGLTLTCNIRHCMLMRQVLDHMDKCLHEDGCSVAHCRSSKRILRHFNVCSAWSCDVCTAVKRPLIKADIPSHPGTEYQNGPVCNFASSGSKPDTTTMNGIKNPSPHYEVTPTPCSSSPALNGEIGRNNRNSFPLTDEQRKDAMKKFVNVSLSIFPAANSTAYNDPRMQQFLDHLKRMEKDIFMKSKTAEEYYAALTARYQSIHSELKEQRRLRGARPLEPSNEESNIKNDAHSGRSSESTEPDRVCDGSELVCKREDATPVEEPRSSPVSSSATSFVKSVPMDTVAAQQVNQDCCEPPTSTPSTEIKSSSIDTTQPATAPITRSPRDGDANSDVALSSDVKPSDEPKSEAGQQPLREASNRAVWYPNELQRYFLPVVDRISKEKDAEPFLQPVDWESLEIYDYPQIITHPMDLSTIRKKLENREYKDPWSVVDDFWLMFNNAWLYNKKTSKVYKTCTKLAEFFETTIDPVMQQLGFCCGREYYYLPPPLTCLTPKFCTIQRDAVYYVYKNDDQTPGLLEQKYTVCERCYNEAGDEIRLDSESSTVVTVQKNLMEKCKNDRKEKEPFVFCKKCGRKWHRVCAIHADEVWPEGFVCNRCMRDYGLKRPENRYTARKLPTCRLSNFLEKRVNDFLKKKGTDASDVIIRVLASADKTVEVKPGMKSRFCETGDMPESFPYRVKAIFAFQEIDGQEVCFFGLHVQEYGSECPPPNTRRVYLAYLDSVYFFRPKQYRTDVYHEILVGYIHYAKLLGYAVAHIWACPPSEGDDYIFHMHPTDQKIPKPKRLQEWYQKMLKKALLERIVVDYKDICQEACESGLVSPTELAYFEGDFWPNTLEELFKEMDEEDAKRKREQEALARDDEDDETKENLQTRENEKNPGKKKAKKRKMKRNASLSLPGKRKRLNGGNSADASSEVARRVYEIMEKHKENFFVIRLHPQNSVSSLPAIKDLDPLINSDLMECRGAFLERAREKHLEFSSVRRAKYSTLVMLYELHTENRQPLMYTCNMCNVQLETPWHCRQCVEYDLCPRCYETEKHPHPMVQIGLGLDDGTKNSDVDSEAAAVQESGRDKLSRLVKALGHGCSCRDANCRVFACKTMKSNVQHFRVHAAAARNQCNVCRSLSFLCYYHSKTCQELKCPVPLCPKWKAKMKQQQKQQRLEQTQMLRRRMATMQRYNSMASSQQSDPSGQTPQPQHQTPSASDSVSSPVSTSTQLSPYGPNPTGPATTSFPAMTSPLSRTSASLPSPQQQPSFYQSSSSLGSVQHAYPKQVASNSTVLSSPSLTSPQHMGSATYSSASPYNSAVHQTVGGCMDSPDVMKGDVGSSPAYAYQSLHRSQSVVLPPGGMMHQSRSHQLDRPQSAQFNSGPSPQPSVPSGHPQLIRQSSGSSQYNAPLSPRYQQFYAAQPATGTDTQTYVQSGVSIPPRVCTEGQHSSHPKQPSQLASQRHSSCVSLSEGQHPGLPAPAQYPPGISTANPSWRPPPPNPNIGSNPNMYNPIPQTRGPSSPCAPNVTVARTIPAPLPSTPHPCLTPPLGSGGTVSMEDVQLVKQTYNEMRQRGALMSDFSSWLNANPHLSRAWQFLQQSHIQAQQQQQQPLTMGPGSNAVPVAHPGSMTVPSSTNCYSVCQALSTAPQPTLNSRSVRHPPQAGFVSNQPSLPFPQSQQWNPMSLQHARFRPAPPPPPPPGSQPQFPYYQQASKVVGPTASPVGQQPPQLNPAPPRYVNQMGVVSHPSQSQLTPPSQLPVSPPMGGVPLPRGGGMIPHGSQAQLLRPGNSNLSSVSLAPGPGMTMGPTRSHQPHPQYSSSVMLSQLLGPGQQQSNGSGAVNLPLPSSHYPMIPPSQAQQSLSRPDFGPSSNILPVTPHYQESGNI